MIAECMKRIENNECVGCGECAFICPVNCISMHEDEEGFVYPAVDERLCNGCGECIRRCSSKNESNACVHYKKTYVCWNKNEKDRILSSSGGVFSVLSRLILQKKGVVYGAAFSEDFFSVNHIRVDRVDDLYKIMGSKYIQSEIHGAYSKIEKDLIAKKMVLFSGTPCQVAAIKNAFCKYRDQMILVSVICHGVPSKRIWERYLIGIQKEYNHERISELGFRDKGKSWDRFSLKIKFEKGVYCNEFSNDLYMRAYLENLFLRPSCYELSLIHI